MKKEKQETEIIVKERYAQAAKQKEEALCCPTGYSVADTAHIPKEVLDTAYGCGNPAAFAMLQGGETIVDLGSGAGIDCFIAAKIVGKEGKVIGVDMTDAMLEKANKNKLLVEKALGFKNIEFKKGHLESLPLQDKSAHMIMSNCVINLSSIKQGVFNEMYRVLQDGGSFMISDIVAEKEVPESMKQDKELWSGCISGAETMEKYLGFMEKAGFFGLQVLKQFLWKEVDGIKFYSAMIKGHKLSRSKDCVYVGETATYRGPLKEAKDDEDHTFKRGIPQEVCTETAKRLRERPYQNFFIISNPKKEKEQGEACEPKDNCC